MRPDRGVEGVGCFGCAVTRGRERYVKVTADGGKELRSKGPHLQVYILKRVWENVM